MLTVVSQTGRFENVILRIEGVITHQIMYEMHNVTTVQLAGIISNFVYDMGSVIKGYTVQGDGVTPWSKAAISTGFRRQI